MLLGAHWLGPPLGVVLFGLWCGWLAARAADAGGGLMDLGLDGKVALVTGGSKGIGLGIAAGARRRGRARRRRVARPRSGSDAAADRIGGHGVVFDSDDLDAVPGVIADVEAALGPIDIYVANTGGPPAGPDPLGFTREQWEAAHRTLVLSPMAFLERLLPGMRDARLGPRRRDRLDVGARADRRAPALQRAPARARRRVQGAREARPPPTA